MKPRIAILLAAQTLPSPEAQTPVLSTESTVVLVPTLVRNSSGELVFTLKASDFTITDDGQEQKVHLDEDSDSQPLALVIAFETGGSGAKHIASYRNLGPLIESVVGDVQHTVAVVTFDSGPKVAQDFTPDMGQVRQAIQNLSAGDSGAAILDSVGFSVSILRRQPPIYRRAILLISETVDRGSHVPMQEALREISDTNTAIYSAAFSTTHADLAHNTPRVLNDDTPGPRHGCMSTDKTIEVSDSTDPNDDPKPAPKQTAKQRAAQAYNCLALLAPPLGFARVAYQASVTAMRQNTAEAVAQLTGGEYFQFKDARTLERDLVTISNHVPNRYVLSFQPSSPHPGLHVIQLKLKQYPNLEVTSRSSYWADSTSDITQHQ